MVALRSIDIYKKFIKNKKFESFLLFYCCEQIMIE